MQKGRRFSILLFTFYFSWLLAFPFQGQILYALAVESGMDTGSFTLLTLTAHVAGLFSSGFFTFNTKQAVQRMLISIPTCLACSLFFFFAPSLWWCIALMIMSFLSGVCVAAWGCLYRAFTPPGERNRTAAGALAYSNLLMTALNVAVIILSPRLALGLSLIMLAVAFYLAFELRHCLCHEVQTVPESSAGSARALIFLCGFILVISINSGILYQVVLPAFGHLTWLSGWYWALPYVAALLISKWIPARSKSSLLLYAAIALMGLSFTTFMVLDRSAVSYLVVITMLMGACGIFDLYGWTILGRIPCWGNPARTLGCGLSANVLGILVGGFLGKGIMAAGLPRFNPSILALMIVFVILMIVPALYNRVIVLLGREEMPSAAALSHAMNGLNDNDKNRKAAPGNDTAEQEPQWEEEVLASLSQREKEVVRLLMRGRTYRMIAQETCLSENTIKTHIRNSYAKLDVRSKSELIHLFTSKQSLKCSRP